jgi:uncharacterized protein (TIGR02466 family)|tara:strand:- start:105 stop:674 length:570 start_codon:yes stop_codon:yes gene_type:complete
MAKEILFLDEVIIENHEDYNLEKKILYCLDHEKKLNNKVIASNMGGFQTPNITDELICKNLVKKIGAALTKEYDLKNIKIRLDNLWINENKKNDFNIPHNHPYSNFSGVYYVSVPKEGGEIMFLRNDPSVGGSNNFKFLKTSNFFTSCTIKPKKNMLLIFSSHISHMVKPHLENMNRISVSFNVVLSKN